MAPSLPHPPPVAETASPGRPTARPPVVHELVGVYHANGALLGEVSYWIKARLGRGHCPLCDITHTSVREKPEWRRCRDTLGVPFRTVHLDERAPDVVAATDGWTPCVVAVTDDGVRRLLGPADLEACSGSPEQLLQQVRRAAAEQGLRLPA